MGYYIHEIVQLRPVYEAWDELDADLHIHPNRFFLHPDIQPCRLSIIEPEAVIPWDAVMEDLPEDPSPFFDVSQAIDAESQEDSSYDSDETLDSYTCERRSYEW